MKKIFATVITVAMVLVMSISSAFAVDGLVLEINKEWSYRADTRSCAYSTVYARCLSVSPNAGGTDNLTYIETVVSNSANGYWISDVYKLYESATGNSSIQIKEGYLNVSNIYFQFRGSDSSVEAYARVNYDGR